MGLSEMKTKSVEAAEGEEEEFKVEELEEVEGGGRPLGKRASRKDLFLEAEALGSAWGAAWGLALGAVARRWAALALAAMASDSASHWAMPGTGPDGGRARTATGGGEGGTSTTSCDSSRGRTAGNPS